VRHAQRPAGPTSDAVGLQNKENGGLGMQLHRGGHEAVSDLRRRSSGQLPGQSTATCTGSAGSSTERRRSGMEHASSSLYVVRGRTCMVLGDCLQDDPADCLTVCVSSSTGLTVSWCAWVGGPHAAPRHAGACNAMQLPQTSA
jgi:hypothetical protein